LPKIKAHRFGHTITKKGGQTQMEKTKDQMNTPEYNQSEKPAHDAFTKDRNIHKSAEKDTDINLENTPKQEHKKTRGNIDNLVDMNHRTEEEQRAIATAGGKASGEARRKKKELKDRCKILLEMMPNKALIAKSLGDDTKLPEGADMYDLMIAKMMQVAALDGNVKAFEAVRDSAGDKPTEKVQQDIAVMTDKDKELMKIIESRMSSGNKHKAEQ
jgi:hypothetical protein